MGVTIHYRLGQEKEYVKSTLDQAQAVAEKLKEQAGALGIPFKIRRFSDTELYIDIGECETLTFDFNNLKVYVEQKEKGWNYPYATLIDRGGKLDEDLEYTSAFCKTQFANNIAEHKFVADLVRVVASRCCYVKVHDEGGYYHSGNLNDAVESIGANGVLIDSISGMLGGLGYKEENIVKGGETKIGRKRK